MSASTFDRIVRDVDLPAEQYDHHAEQIVIGAMLMTRDAITEVTEIVRAEDFHRHQHGTLFTAILAARDSGSLTEPVAVAGKLYDSGDLDRIGGINYMHECMAAVPTAANAGFYARRVAEVADRRRFVLAGIKIEEAASKPGRSAAQLAELAEKLIRDVEPRDQVAGLTPFSAMVTDGLADIEMAPMASPGLATGFKDLDRLLGGIQKQEIVILAARPGMGKTVLAMDIARHAAFAANKVVAFFSLEMTRQQLFRRIVAAECRIPNHRIKSGDLTLEEWKKITKRIGEVADAPLFLDDSKKLTIGNVANRCRKLHAQAGRIDAVFIDYLGIMSRPRGQTSEQEIADLSREMKILAADLDSPIFLVAQLNRALANRNVKVPELTDLRGSGSLEQDADTVIFVHREDYYDSESPRAGEADFVVAKHRDGRPDTVTVAAQLDKFRFVDMAIV